MNQRGVSLALNTVGIAIMVLIVVLVVGIIFFGYMNDVVQLRDQCGAGTLDAYSCVAERTEGGLTHCFPTRNTERNCLNKVIGIDDGNNVFCCRVN
jgi:hypothetical protein